MVRYRYAKRFDRIVKKLPESIKNSVKEAAKSVIRFYETGVKTGGLGLKKVSKDYWEIRSNLGIRILFKFEDDLITFTLAGNHDEIRRFLKGI